jgi:hypothetical protein
MFISNLMLILSIWNSSQNFVGCWTFTAQELLLSHKQHTSSLVGVVGLEHSRRRQGRWIGRGCHRCGWPIAKVVVLPNGRDTGVRAELVTTCCAHGGEQRRWPVSFTKGMMPTQGFPFVESPAVVGFCPPESRRHCNSPIVLFVYKRFWGEVPVPVSGVLKNEQSKP